MPRFAWPRARETVREALSVSSNSNRRRLASEQARRWAYEAVDDGEYLEAISWLRVLEVIEGSLPHTLSVLRSRCVSAFGAQMERFPHRTTEPDTPDRVPAFRA
jgi:hypothetical protein